jgi:hypothetical protein
MRSIFFLFLIFFSFNALLAQEIFSVKGIIFQQENKQRVTDVKILNLRSDINTLSDEWGNFTIDCSVGDTLIFKKDSFQELIKIISAKQNLVIYLQQGVLLKEIVVKEQSKASEQKEIMDGYRSKGIYFNGNPPLLFSLFHPLTAIHELLSKDAKDAKRFANYIERENAESAVDGKFNKYLIQQYTSIDEKDIAEFMFLYRPKPEEIRIWNEYDMINYLKKSFKSYQEYKSKDSIFK